MLPDTLEPQLAIVRPKKACEIWNSGINWDTKNIDMRTNIKIYSIIIRNAKIG